VSRNFRINAGAGAFSDRGEPEDTVMAPKTVDKVSHASFPRNHDLYPIYIVDSSSVKSLTKP
jgi:hypothetical protein